MITVGARGVTTASTGPGRSTRELHRRRSSGRAVHRRAADALGDGLRGISRAKGPRTTISWRRARPATGPGRTRRSRARRAPDQLWVADITYCRTFTGWVYAAFVTDVFSRRVVGWQLSTSACGPTWPSTPWRWACGTGQRAGRDSTGLIGPTTAIREFSIVAVRYTQRLAEAGAVASVGSTGDSYDNALAEAFNSLFKAELIRNKGPVEEASTTSRSRSLSTSTGSTIAGSTARSA